jgi:hypothetical protein
VVSIANSELMDRIISGVGIKSIIGAKRVVRFDGASAPKPSLDPGATLIDVTSPLVAPNPISTEDSERRDLEDKI